MKIILFLKNRHLPSVILFSLKKKRKVQKGPLFAQNDPPHKNSGYGPCYGLVKVKAWNSMIVEIIPDKKLS